MIVQKSKNETELLVFAIIATALNTRRRGHVNFLPYISCACTMAKIANFILFFLNRPSYGLSYSVVILAHMLMFPKPRYRGPDQVTYFVGDDFERELTKDPKANWLIEFYETWNPDCNDFAGVFSELSAKFANEKLKFGKIDVSRSPKVAEKHQVVSSMTSRTLPTLILFKNGKESLRRPVLDSRRRVVPFSFSYVSTRIRAHRSRSTSA